jgi:DNA mismatch repair ATPase MutS
MSDMGRVAKGVELKSWGVHCAILAGMDDDLVRRAQHVTEQLAQLELPNATVVEDEYAARMQRIQQHVHDFVALDPQGLAKWLDRVMGFVSEGSELTPSL